MKLTRPCVGILIIVLSACSVINFLTTVAAILLSTGVVDVSADFQRMSLAVTCDGERVEYSKCCWQSVSKCCSYSIILTDLLHPRLQSTTMLPSTLIVTLLGHWKWLLLLTSHKVVDLQQGQVSVPLLCTELQQH